VAAAHVRHLYERFREILHEVAKFGVVGAFNYVLDVGLFNLLVTSGGLHHKPLTAKTISTVVAATSSFFMNRHWTWRDKKRRGLLHEYGTFIALSAVALLITLGCLAFGEYVLAQNSLLSRNIWGNVVGVGAAMVFRFWSFRRWVFTSPEPERTKESLDAAIL
jgi:putative flippase GtrA